MLLLPKIMHPYKSMLIFITPPLETLFKYSGSRFYTLPLLLTLYLGSHSLYISTYRFASFFSKWLRSTPLYACLINFILSSPEDMLIGFRERERETLM